MKKFCYAIFTVLCSRRGKNFPSYLFLERCECMHERKHKRINFKILDFNFCNEMNELPAVQIFEHARQHKKKLLIWFNESMKIICKRRNILKSDLALCDVMLLVEWLFCVCIIKGQQDETGIVINIYRKFIFLFFFVSGFCSLPNFNRVQGRNLFYLSQLVSI